jgi:hypothetical protein
MLFIFQIEMFSFSSISGDVISLQALCQIFVDRPAWLESSIPRPLASDIHIHFIDGMCPTALLLLTSITVCVLNSIVNYDQSKRVTQVGAFDRKFAFCGAPNISFNHDRRSTSWFKIFSSYQKVNSVPKSNRSGSDGAPSLFPHKIQHR